MKAFKLILIAAGVVLAGCSNHHRTSDSSLTASEVQGMLQEVQGAQANALALKDQEGAWLYVAQAPTSTLKVANIVSFVDFAALGITGVEGYNMISEARVLFLDLPDHQGVELIIGVKTANSDQYQYSVFTGNGSVSNGIFTADLSGPAQITIKTYDTKGGDLADVIQLRIFVNGEQIGKVSVLTGFAL